MATTTVTISADEDLVRKAEQFARQNQTDLQSILTRYLSAMAASDEPLDLSKLPPITRSALGFLSGLPDKPDSELLTDALADKHGPPK